MSEEAFLKCACSYCQGRIEFPAHALGITTTCPHCGVETTLVTPDAVVAPPPPPPAGPALATTPKPPPPPAATATPTPPALVVGDLTPVAPASAGAKLKKVLTVVWGVLVGLSVLGFFGLKIWRAYRNTERVVVAVKGEPQPEQPKTASVQPNATSKTAPKTAVMPAPVAVPTSVVVAKGTPPPRKPGEDLQVLSFEVQKAKDGNLQYVIGVVTNHSGKQLFNVKLEFELTRMDGKTGDPATDAIRNLAPNAGVTFKASIIGNAPVTGAKLAKLEGEKE